MTEENSGFDRQDMEIFFRGRKIKPRPLSNPTSYQENVELSAFENQKEYEFVYLYHYTSEKFDGPINAETFWSPLETLTPEFAGEGVGIGAIECAWRATWKLSAQEIEERLIFGNSRFCKVGVIYEFQNRMEVAANEILWTKMDPLGTIGSI